MGAASFFGHALLGLGPGLAFFLVVLAPKSFVVLLTLASAFLWLTVLLLVSAVLRPWAPLPLSGDARAAAGALLAAVAVEEVVRLGVVAAHSRMCAVLRRMAAASPGHTFGRADELLLALAWGYGQAAVHGLFIFASLLPLTAGHGTLYVDVCPAMSVLLVAALNCLALGATLSALSVIALEAWARQRRMGAAYAPLAHAGAALLTLGSLRPGGCTAAVSAQLALSLVNIMYAGSVAWRTGGGPAGASSSRRAGLAPQASSGSGALNMDAGAYSDGGGTTAALSARPGGAPSLRSRGAS